MKDVSCNMFHRCAPRLSTLCTIRVSLLFVNSVKRALKSIRRGIILRTLNSFLSRFIFLVEITREVSFLSMEN